MLRVEEVGELVESADFLGVNAFLLVGPAAAGEVLTDGGRSDAEDFGDRQLAVSLFEQLVCFRQPLLDRPAWRFRGGEAERAFVPADGPFGDAQRVGDLVEAPALTD